MDAATAKTIIIISLLACDTEKMSEQCVCMCVLECSLLVNDRGFIGDKVNGIRLQI